ncbi:MAG: T9SS type A sorting domain-containing protein [Bacteroidales bacterium]|nr:T9SS type A sorting domain-containing protein [Bacteroidales bacterium]HOI32285.1 T9SS type A sorting domain-containing protein [Bacteroidales bacterium]
MKIFTLFLSTFLISIWLQGQNVLHYDFTNSFTEKHGSGPDLTVLGNTGTFVEDVLGELDDARKWVYRFERNSGFQFDNAAAGSFLGEDYSIEIYFVFDELSSWKRVVDLKNRKSDRGAYVFNGRLNFYNIAMSDEAPIAVDEYTYYVITRDAETKEVKVYTDAEIEINFTDNSGDALLDEDNVLNFFQDDFIVPNEASPGAVAMVKIYNYALDSTAIANNYDDLAGNLFFIGEQKKTNTTIHTFPNPASQYLNLDLSNFTMQRNISIRLTDLFGRILLLQEVSDFPASFQLDISSIGQGFYLLSVEGDDRKASSKVVINH